MSIGIYKFTNKINNKMYIGQSIHIERRYHEHITSIKNTVFHKALKKYGIDNFLFEIVEICEIDKLDEKEIYYIKQYNSLVPNGYNVQIGGESGKIEITEEIMQIQNDIKNTNISYADLSRKYNLVVRTLYRINKGEVWYDENLSYPLRPLQDHSKKEWYCIDCGKPVSKGAIRCPHCSALAQQKVDRPDKYQLAKEIIELGFEGTGRKYGVSGNAIKKWCKVYQIPYYKTELKEWLMKNI